jgi:hypothetical protein
MERAFSGHKCVKRPYKQHLLRMSMKRVFRVALFVGMQRNGEVLELTLNSFQSVVCVAVLFI